MTNLIGEWRVCQLKAAPMVYLFTNFQEGEKGLLANWSNPSRFIYKTAFTYTIMDAPKDSLTGNPIFDENLFLMNIKSISITGGTYVQSFLMHIATKDSISFVLKHGFISPFCKVQK